MPIFTGSGVALVTPFTKDGVDYAAFEKQIDFQIANQTDALIVAGTTGEPSTMTNDEREAVIGFVIEHTRKRVPVIAGTGSNSTSSAVAASKKAQDMGADALLVVTPYYNKTTPQGLVAHYQAISDSVSLPIIAYNVPGRTGLNVTPQTLFEMSKIKNVRGMKEASGNIEQIVEMTRLCGDRLDFYSGNDDHVLPLLALGFVGVISVVANIAPKAMHELVAAYFKGDIAKSRGLQYQLNPVTKCLFSETSPIPVKTAMNAMGLSGGELRLPLVPMQEDTKAKLFKAMQAFGLSVTP